MTFTGCDCSQPRLTGVIDPSDMLDCKYQEENVRHQAILYDTFLIKARGRRFDGYVCRMWDRIKRIDEGILFNHDTTFKDEHHIVSPQECWTIVQTSRRGENQMLRSGSLWSFTGDPQGEGHWWSQTEYRMRNCEFEKVTLEQDCDNCTIMSVIGEVTHDHRIGSAILGLRTVVWDNSGQRSHQCNIQKLSRRKGELIVESGRVKPRDQDLQADFILGEVQQTCDPKLQQLVTV